MQGEATAIIITIGMQENAAIIPLTGSKITNEITRCISSSAPMRKYYDEAGRGGGERRLARGRRRVCR